jgi:RNA polymerase sigma-70 factor (ECF subfamily)
MDVRDAMLGLSQDHREVLVLGYHQQLTQSEIAVQLGIPLGTVKTRTYHALRALRTQLEELRLL